MKKHLLVVLQTYADANALESSKTSERFVGKNKEEVSKRCVLSLINSLNYAKFKDKDLEIKLQIFDDGSNIEYLKILKKICILANFSVSFDSLNRVGIMKSIKQCYNYAKNKVKNKIYFVQDDFLHCESSIHFMLSNYEIFSKIAENDVIVTGNHCSRFTRISENVVIGCRILRGLDQYWRTAHSTQFTMLTSADLFLNNYDLFEKFGNQKYELHCEDKSLNKLCTERGYWVFCPISSTVLNIQWENHTEPYIDWYGIWESFDLRRFNII